MVACYALRGSTGFGAAAAMPLLALVIPLKVLIPAWTLIGLAAGLALLRRDRPHIGWADMARLFPTCLIGVDFVAKVCDERDQAPSARRSTTFILPLARLGAAARGWC